MNTERAYTSVTRVATLLLVLGLAACAPAPTPSPTLAPIPPPATLAPTQTPPPTETPIPTVTNTPFVPKAIVKVVSQSPADVDIAKGAQLAVEQLAGPLRDLGFEAQFVAYDDQNNVDVAARNAHQIIEDPAVLCGVGHYTSAVTINTMDLYHLAGLAFVSPSATKPDVTDKHYPEINRVTGRNDVLGAAMAKFVLSQGLTTVFLARDDSDFSNQARGLFRSDAAQAGFKIVDDLVVSAAIGNDAAVASRVLAANPDAVFYIGFAPDAGPFFRQVRLDGYQGMLLSLDADLGLASAAGPLALEGKGLYYVDTVGLVEATAAQSKFASDFRGEFGKQPGPFAVEAYDAAGVCLKAIEQAVIAKAGELPTRPEVAKAIRSLKDYVGITGTFGFTQNGDPTTVRYFVKQAVTSDPGKWGDNPVVATFELPPPK